MHRLPHRLHGRPQVPGVGLAGALAAPPTAPKLAHTPKAPPHSRVTAPMGPMDMVMRGVSGRRAAAWAVACSSRAASAASRGITASLATSAPASAMDTSRSVMATVTGVLSKSWQLNTTAAPA